MVSLLAAILPLATIGEEVPVVDLSGSLNEAVAVVNASLRRFGFFYVSAHGVPAPLIDSMFDQSRQLFALPRAVKAAMPFNGTLDIGYLGSGGQALDEESGIGDTKEGFMLTNNGVFDPNFTLSRSDPLRGATLHWPPAEALPDFEAVVRAYTAELSRLNHRLNALLFAAVGLGEAERLTLARQPFTVTKLMRYQPDAHAEEGALGAGAHADWGALTLLATDGTPGLQVELDGEWLPVAPRPGCFIVNAGDQIQHWTNGELRSANHRVLTTTARPRFSTAFFTYFDLHAKVAALPQFVSDSRPPLRPEETTLEYFHFKLRESVAGKVDGECEAAGAA